MNLSVFIEHKIDEPNETASLKHRLGGEMYHNSRTTIVPLLLQLNEGHSFVGFFLESIRK